MRNAPSESTEVLEPLKIVILEPEGDKHFMMGFGNTLAAGKYSEQQMDAYNYAIGDVLHEASLRAFHQVGAGEKDGAQMWEVRTEDIERDFLEKMIPSIHAKAEEYAQDMML